MNAVFIHIPKTAGITIRDALGLKRYKHPLSGLITTEHKDYARDLEQGNISKEFDESSFKFTFCRNPYDRAVSHYFYLKKAHPELVENIDFKEFTSKPHAVPQYENIKKIKIDFIGRFENLEEDIKKVAKILGINVSEIPHRNSTKHKPYWEYYCEESRKNIEKFYKIDFKKFGYDLHSNHRL